MSLTEILDANHLWLVAGMEWGMCYHATRKTMELHTSQHKAGAGWLQVRVGVGGLISHERNLAPELLIQASSQVAGPLPREELVR